MKISVDDVELFTLSETQMKIFKNDIVSEALEDDLKRRLSYIIFHKYENCFQRLKEQWEPKLIARGYQALPTDKEAFAELVFSQPDYQDRKQREISSISNQ